MPPFPARFIHYWRMKIDALTPQAYWDTAMEDYELAEAVQRAVHEGWRDAEEDHEARQERG